MVTPWNYSENMGALSNGQYELNVNEYFDETLIQTYPLSFEVILEPASLLLLSIGSIGIRRYSRKRY